MQIQDDFRIDAPESLALSVDIWRLPPRSSTALLRDNNSVKVARSTGPELSLRVGLSRLVHMRVHARLDRQTRSDYPHLPGMYLAGVCLAMLDDANPPVNVVPAFAWI